jgi:hypothetical protein
MQFKLNMQRLLLKIGKVLFLNHEEVYKVPCLCQPRWTICF